MFAPVRRAVLVAALILPGLALATGPADAANPQPIATAAFTGASGTIAVGGILYAKNGATLTLTVTTSVDIKCVDVAGAFTAHQQSTTAKTSWTFTTTAGSGDGTQAVSVSASEGFNPQDKCTSQTATAQASYVLDNTGPVVTSVLAPAPSSAGWNRTNTTLTWTATDVGAGVDTGPTPASSSETTDGIFVRTSTATDMLGNSGAGSATVRVDKTDPTISATQTTAGPGQPTTVTFTCDDAGPGASGIATCLADGSTTSATTVDINGTVTGTATDTAGNTKTLSVAVNNVDTSAPSLSGAPTTQPNSQGWYRNDVTVHWTASDLESGIPNVPADTIISGEGAGLTSSQTVTNGAGLSTTATSSPTVRIDRTAPTTGVSGESNAWTDGAVTLTLSPTDNLSQVDHTVYAIDGGTDQTGTMVMLSAEGDHTVSFHSVDKAGNAEVPQTLHVKIDKTAPTIRHTFEPTTYLDGAWTNGDVTVTFTCQDQGGSLVASCSDPVTKSAEGEYSITGTATDGAGNTANDQANVRIDKTPPTITATAVGDKNAAGWYKDDVAVTFECHDEPSGIASCPAGQNLGEGRDQTSTGTATDRAGNSASDRVSGIHVDKTAPVLTGTFDDGWHTGDVTVHWTCTDPGGSGVKDDGPANTIVHGEGGNLSSTAMCTDVAGNSTTTTVDGIRIDRTAPLTTATVPAPLPSGWYGGPVDVTLDGQDNLSEVASTHYTVDGGDVQTYDGPFSFGTEGTHTIEFWSTDRAGNVETAGTPLALNIDETAPVTRVVNPISPDNGWFVKSGIPFAFSANDNGAGVATTYYTIDGDDPQTYGQAFTRDLSDGSHTISYWSVDLAGNAEPRRSFRINLDTVPPKIVGTAAPMPNAFGWNNSDVDVTFTCTDDTSGIPAGVAGCAGDTTLQNEGTNQKVIGDAVDMAGNHNSSTYGPVNIDKTAPTLSGTPSESNGAGWYRGDVTVTWTGDDALSGIDTSTQPEPSTVSGEGRDLGATAQIKDKAGNTGNGAVTGLNIDRSKPTVTGRPNAQPNADGWYRDAVTVDWTCADPDLADKTLGSGVASCPTSARVTGDGAGQSVTSGLPTDVAGNAGEAARVGRINIDGTAPSTTAQTVCTLVNTWCTGSTANVTLKSTDQEGLSGVKEIHYRVDGGAEQVAEGDLATVAVPLDGTGAATLTYWSVDKAGNAETANSAALKWDNLAPTVTHTLTPAPNADGWNQTTVTVTFNGSDEDSGSGVARVSDPVTISSETGGTKVEGSATDIAGNRGTDSVTVRLDQTAPTIIGEITEGTKGDNGWYTGPVTVSFTCSDVLSGVPETGCPGPVVLTSNGSTNAATGTVLDRAGNSASATVSGIKIDQEKPTLTTAGVNVSGGSYALGTAPKATCTATDDVSGLASCTVQVTGGSSTGVGTFAWTATARDNAGNTTTVTGTYKVMYRFDGFLQPINDTAHQTGTSTSIFKAGSTVPAKLQLKRADGTVVLPGTAPVWLTPVKGSATSAPVDESAYTAAADSGTAYRYDSTAQQWIYNWKTGSTAGSYWRIGVMLDDGMTYYVNIGLR